jgi:hypothetical protein
MTLYETGIRTDREEGRLTGKVSHNDDHYDDLVVSYILGR